MVTAFTQLLADENFINLLRAEALFDMPKQSYGDNVLNLTLIRGYAKKLMENGRVARFLKANYPDILDEFETIATAETL